MADTISSDPSVEQGTWHTVEHAAVALGLSVRTVNRHIQAGKIRSRLTEGRREVFVPQPERLNDNPPDTASAVVGSGPDDGVMRDTSTPSNEPEPGARGDVDPSTASTNSSTTATSFPSDRQASNGFGANMPFDVESALARADNAADKAELAVSAYQNLARAIEAQAHSARRGARFAWSVVAVLAVAAGVAIWWTATTVTQAKMEADRLQREVNTTSKMADDHAAELERLRTRLSTAEQDAARAQGRAEALEQVQSKKPTSQPSLLERLTSAFANQAPAEH